MKHMEEKSMAWCPKCKEEYEAHIELCAECQVPLVQTIEEVETECQLMIVKTEEESERALEFLEYSGIKTATALPLDDTGFCISVHQDDREAAVRFIQGFLVGEKEEVETEDYYFDEYRTLDIEDNFGLIEMKSGYKALLGFGGLLFVIGAVDRLELITLFTGNIAYVLMGMGALFIVGAIATKKILKEKENMHYALKEEYQRLYKWYVEAYPIDTFEMRHAIEYGDLDEGAKYFLVMDKIVREVGTNDMNAKEEMVNTVADKVTQHVLMQSRV